MNRMMVRFLLTLAIALPVTGNAFGQAYSPAGTENGSTSSGSIATPRPINPATGTTNPSARATQTLNPYLGSISVGPLVPGEMKLSLEDAIARGLKFNLGLIENQQAGATVRAQRERALSALLPQISARAQQTYQQLSYKELGLKLPAKAGFQLPASSGSFGYSDARIVAQSAILNVELLNRYKEQKALEAASLLNIKDARDVVTYAVGAAYFQVVASAARLATTEAALLSAQEVSKQTADEYKAEVSLEIDTLRTEVQLHTAEQRVVDARNDLEKDKLTLDRITGLSIQQVWTPDRQYGFSPLPEVPEADSNALSVRSDLASLKQTVTAAELDVKAARAERLPAVSVEGEYGGAGTNPANYSQVYAVTGTISIPIFTSGRIRSERHEAESALVQRRAEYQDLEGRVAYDVHVAMLDAKASESAVHVAEQNQHLAQNALSQSQDRYQNGVTNDLEVVQAQETLVAAKENLIGSLFSFNVAKISLARALGSSESRIATLFSVQ